MRQKVCVLGCMSGSSLDGLDVALCCFSGSTPRKVRWENHWVETIIFPDHIARSLDHVTELTAKELYQLEYEFSVFTANAIIDLIMAQKLHIDYISSHGHTVYHFPFNGFSVQLGRGSIIAELTGIPCITDFRSSDIAQGGQGAPIAPIVERWLYPGYDIYLNLGGIANVSFHTRDDIISFDSCPCNQILNLFVAERGLVYDDRGQLARRGRIIPELLEQWLALDYMSLSPPKSLDNSWVKSHFAPLAFRYSATLEDRLATMVEFIAIQLTNDIKSRSRVSSSATATAFATGGGVHNDFLLERIKHHCDTQWKLVKPNNKTINFKEAILMSLMGYLRVKEIPNTIPSVTGAKSATVGGAIWIPNT